MAKPKYAAPPWFDFLPEGRSRKALWILLETTAAEIAAVERDQERVIDTAWDRWARHAGPPRLNPAIAAAKAEKEWMALEHALCGNAQP